jgi:hypothetical protein
VRAGVRGVDEKEDEMKAPRGRVKALR